MACACACACTVRSNIMLRDHIHTYTHSFLRTLFKQIDRIWHDMVLFRASAYISIFGFMMRVMLVQVFRQHSMSTSEIHESYTYTYTYAYMETWTRCWLTWFFHPSRCSPARSAWYLQGLSPRTFPSSSAINMCMYMCVHEDPCHTLLLVHDKLSFPTHVQLHIFGCCSHTYIFLRLTSICICVCIYIYIYTHTRTRAQTYVYTHAICSYAMQRMPSFHSIIHLGKSRMRMYIAPFPWPLILNM